MKKYVFGLGSAQVTVKFHLFWLSFVFCDTFDS